MKKCVVVMMVLCIAGAGAHGDVIELQDAQLSNWGLWFSPDGSTFDGTADLAGDPGTQLQMTMAPHPNIYAGPGTTSWSQIDTRYYTNVAGSNGIGAGDDWSIEIHNPMNYWVTLEMWVDHSGYSGYVRGLGVGGQGNIGPGATETFSVPAIPGPPDRMALLIDVPNWGYPNGGATSSYPLNLNIIPEPTTLALLGAGGVALVRSRRKR
jgi:hypothetical protein